LIITNKMRSIINRLRNTGLETDPDIAGELDTSATSAALPKGHPAAGDLAKCPYHRAIALRIVNGSHAATQGSANLLREAGGADTIHAITSSFYRKVFVDPHLQLFFGDIMDPHAERLGNWIVEKMGGHGAPWTAERRRRSAKEVILADGSMHVVHDRSSAHVAAWYSPKRPAANVGEHFKLDDCRMWMRLHFWAARENGLFDDKPQLMDWYVRFIAHFVKVYERSAPQFARDAARWSADERNLDEYVSNGRSMADIKGLSHRQALAKLPESEREDFDWPYEL